MIVTWDGIRGTLQWMLILLLIGIIAVGAVGLQIWHQKDVLINKTVAEKLASIFPSCEVSFRDVRIVDASEVVLTELLLKSLNDGSTLVKIPRVSIRLAPEILRESRRVVVKKILIDSPQIFALRNPEGTWNWHDFQFQKSNQNYSASIEVINGQFQVGLQSLPAGPIHTVFSKAIEIQIFAEAKQRYRVQGQGNLDSLAVVDLSGMVDTRTGEWSLAGQAAGIRLDEPLLERTGKLVPEVEERLAQIRKTPQFIEGHRVPVRTASSNQSNSVPLGMPMNSHQESPSFLRADLDLRFSLGQSGPGAALDYFVQTSIQNGQISDLFLPIPLYDVSARLEFQPDQIKIENFKATNNQSSLFLNGESTRIGKDWERRFAVQATNLQIDERIQSILPTDLLDLYKLISPSGTFDLDFDIDQQAGQAWSGNLRKFTARNCRVVLDDFRYPIEEVQGDITHVDDRYVMKLAGKASRHPISFTGHFADGTVSRDADFSFQVKNLEVNEKFVNSFGRKDQVGIKNVLISLRLAGVADLSGRFLKNAATANQLQMQLEADVRDSSLNFVNFPYELEGLSGKVQFDGLVSKAWNFKELKARHGHAIFSGEGVFNAPRSPGKLFLELGAVRIPIDADLEKASLTCVPQIFPLWTDFDLAGTIDVEKVGIAWEPGNPTDVTLRGIQWKDGVIKPLAFPYKWDDVVGSLEWTGKRLNIHSLHGWHGETYLDIDGTDPTWPSFIEVPPAGEIAWEVHFGNMRVAKVNVDDELERALPTQIAECVKAMDMQGLIDLHLRTDMRGWSQNREVVTANWELLAVLEENAFSAGVDFSHLTGKIKVRDGTWDGQNLRLEGTIDVKQAVALNLPIKNIRSPFHLEKGRLVIGTPKFVIPPVQYLKSNDYAGKQLRADLYTGQIGYDALILLGDRPELTQYKSELNVNDVELAELAAEQSPNAQRLNGKVNGTMAYQGMGPSLESIRGKGWINIVPAAIMDLPAFAQMFALINFRPVGNAAFNYAYGDFEIQNGRLEFSRIELRGDALGLIGKGVVGFAAGNQSLISLTFDSRSNNRIPLIGRIIDGLGSNWIRVQVTGTVQEPVPSIQPRIGPLDEAFREFTDAIEENQNLRTPLRVGSANKEPSE